MKKDKLEIINNPIIVGKNVEKCLINILMFIKKYPNSGQAIKICCLKLLNTKDISLGCQALFQSRC